MTQGNNNNTALDKYDNDSNDIFLLFKLKILNAIKFISNRKKRADLEAIFDYQDGSLQYLKRIGRKSFVTACKL